MKSSPYSPLKIFHHQEWLSKIRRGQQPAPLFMQIIPTNRCNQNCHFCAYRIDGYSSNQLFTLQDEIEYPKLKEIVDDCKDMGIKAIELTGGGEPTIHPHFFELCEYILDAGINLGLVTNGAAWKDVYTLALARATWIRVSIDSANPATYSKIRSSSTRGYESARNAIRQLSSLPMRPLIGVGFVVTKENWLEIEQAAENAYEDGADNFRISAFFQNDDAHYFEGFETAVRIVCKSLVERYEGTSLRIFDLFSDRLNDLHQGNPDYSFCGFQQAQTYVGADCNVYRCCNLAYNSRGLLGSIQNQSFKQLWQSIQKQDRVANFDARGCQRCMFNNKNKTILYAIDPAPLHVNFI